ncbi:hypothetical protein ACFXB3_25730, partial [Streptomyces sp. NPDC059447]
MTSNRPVLAREMPSASGVPGPAPDHVPTHDSGSDAAEDDCAPGFAPGCADDVGAGGVVEVAALPPSPPPAYRITSATAAATYPAPAAAPLKKVGGVTGPPAAPR